MEELVLGAPNYLANMIIENIVIHFPLISIAQLFTGHLPEWVAYFSSYSE